jgi:hypothetical protein
MKKNGLFLLSVLIISSVLISACSHDDEVVTPIKVTLSGPYSVSKCKVLNIAPIVTGTSSHAAYKWAIGDSVISTDSVLNFISVKAGNYNVKLKVSEGSRVDSMNVVVNVADASYSDRIAKVLDYNPTFGDDVNLYTADTRSGVISNINSKVSSSVTSIKLDLGFFGGSAIFAFDHTIANVRGEGDFKVIGDGSGTFSVGIIYVAYDKNGNGKPDDEWYEIKGDLEGTSNIISNYQLTVSGTRVDDEETLVSTNAWTDNQGNSGKYSNSVPEIASYDVYPHWINGDYVLTGKLIKRVDNLGTKVAKYAHSFTTLGYQGIDISWAMDSKGNTVNLPGIDFIKIVTADFTQIDEYNGYASLQVNQIYDLHLAK